MATTTATAAAVAAAATKVPSSVISEEEEEGSNSRTYNIIVSCIGIILLAILLILAERRTTRTKGKIWYYHIIYWIITLLIALLILPINIRYEFFSPLSVAVIGTVFPIYESIRAVCTPDGEDDKAWLQYWIVQSTISFATEWIDDIATKSETVRLYWYVFEFLFYLWLLLPYTDGASLVFEYITMPLCEPIIKPIANRANVLLENIIAFAVSASHIWILWISFVFLPIGLKRFVTIGIGVIYPILASIVAVSTTNTYDDDTFWLTYWSCYGILFLLMDILETWFGFIPGFYTLFLLATIYLMVPMFNGADKVFRKVLVPLARQQEMLLLRDAYKVKCEILSSLPEDRHKDVTEAIAKSFILDLEKAEENEKADKEEKATGEEEGESADNADAPKETDPLIK